MKIIKLSVLFLLALTSCKLKGWDSSGGLQPIRSDQKYSLFYIEFGQDFEKEGALLFKKEDERFVLQIPDFSFDPNRDSIASLLQQEAFDLVYFACDQDLKGEVDLQVEEEFAYIRWQESETEKFVLSLSEEGFYEKNYSRIRCEKEF